MDRHLKVRTHPPVLFEHCIQMTTTTKKDNTEDKQSMSPLSEPVVIAEEQERTKKTAPVTKKEQKEEAQQKVKSSTTTTKSREQFFTIFLCAVTVHTFFVFFSTMCFCFYLCMYTQNIWQHHPKVEKEKQNAKEVRKLETIFDLSKLPSVSLPDFVIRSSLSFFFSFHFYILSFLFGGVGRIHKYCEPSIEAWVLSMCYLEILHVKHPSFPIHMLSVHQLILTSYVFFVFFYFSVSMFFIS
jgi:hypothetical protein